MAPWLSSATTVLPDCHARTTPKISTSSWLGIPALLHAPPAVILWRVGGSSVAQRPALAPTCEHYTKTTFLQDKRKVSLMEDMTEIVLLDNIIRHESVIFLDYNSLSACNQILPQDPSPLQEEPCNPSIRRAIDPKSFVVCIMYTTETATSTQNGIRSVEKRHRLIAELKLLHYRRHELLNAHFYSLPYTTFLDGFGLYRNSYHSLAGVSPDPLCLHPRPPGGYTSDILYFLLRTPHPTSTYPSAPSRCQPLHLFRGFRMELHIIRQNGE
ncbi:hypothetical protein EV426DRAFT_621987 [Tirmania nivea]|nr:hypothetical protein EV426DRAFT_621987 [Tirmania nivea]